MANHDNSNEELSSSLSGCFGGDEEDEDDFDEIDGRCSSATDDDDEEDDEENNLKLNERIYRVFLSKCLKAYTALCSDGNNNLNCSNNNDDYSDVSPNDQKRCTELIVILEIFRKEIVRIELSNQFVLVPFVEFEKSLQRADLLDVFTQFSSNFNGSCDIRDDNVDLDDVSATQLGQFKQIAKHFNKFENVCIRIDISSGLSTDSSVSFEIEYGPEYPERSSFERISILDNSGGGSQHHNLSSTKKSCLQQILKKSTDSRVGCEQLYSVIIEASNLLGTYAVFDDCFDVSLLPLDNACEIIRQADRMVQIDSSSSSTISSNIEKEDHLKYRRKRADGNVRSSLLSNTLTSTSSFSSSPTITKRTLTLVELVESRLIIGQNEMKQFDYWTEYCYENIRLALYSPQSSVECFGLGSMRIVTQSIEYIAYPSAISNHQQQQQQQQQQPMSTTTNKSYRVSIYHVNLSPIKRKHSNFFEQLFQHIGARLGQFQQETRSFVEQTKTRTNISHYYNFEIRYRGFEESDQLLQPPSIWFILVKEPLPEPDSKFAFSMEHLKRSLMFGTGGGGVNGGGRAGTQTTTASAAATGGDTVCDSELSRVCLNSYKLLTELSYLHKFGYFHGQFDPQKIFVSNDGDCKLYDSYLTTIIPVLVPAILEQDLHFLSNGLVKIREEQEIVPGTMMIEQQSLVQNCFEDLPLVRTLISNDIFSFGMIVLALATDCDLLPVLPVPGNRVDYVAISRMLTQRMDNRRVVASLKDFVQRCIDPDENNRCALVTLFNHGFMLNYLQSAIGTENNDVNTVDLQLSFDGGDATGSQSANNNKTSAAAAAAASSYPNCSRFKQDFVMLDKLGKGAFGQVYKVRNKWDNQVYAMKCVRIQFMDSTLTREVYNLSRLSHENVVRYYCSWVEEVDQSNENNFNFNNQDNHHNGCNGGGGSRRRKEDYADEDSNEDSEDNFSDDSVQTKVAAPYDDDSLVQFVEDSNVEEQDNGRQCSLRTTTGNTGSGSLTNEGTSLTTTTQSNAKSNRNRKKFILCIQMELCEKKTLRNLINSKKTHSNRTLKYQIFREIIAALLYIHQKDIIHRDLKPNNIFFDKNNHVKIGDFGLSCQGSSGGGGVGGGGITESTTGPQPVPVDLDTQDCPDGSFNFDQSSRVGTDSGGTPTVDLRYTAGVRHTLNLGTFFYTAPELFSGAYANRYYTNKIDMYSLGIIFFEMCYPFGTESERDHVLHDLRRKEIVFPNDVHTYINEKELMLIRRLLGYEPMLRPSADELSLEIEGLADNNPIGGGGASSVYDERSVISKVIQRPTSIQFSYLMNALFNRTTPLFELMSYDYWPVSNHSACTFYRQQQIVNLTGTIFLVYSSHYGGSDLSIPTLIPKNILFESPVSKQRNVLLLDQSGNVLSLPYDFRSQLARFVSFTPYRFSFLCRSSIQKMFIKLTEDDRYHPKEELNASFDFIWPRHYSAECALLYSEIITFATNIVTFFRATSSGSGRTVDKQEEAALPPTIMFQLTNLTILYNLCQLLQLSNLGYQAMIRVLAQNADTIQATLYDQTAAAAAATSTTGIELKPGYQTIRMAIKAELDNVQLQTNTGQFGKTPTGGSIVPIVDILVRLCFLSERSPTALLSRITSILQPHFNEKRLNGFIGEKIAPSIRAMSTIQQLTEAYWSVDDTTTHTQHNVQLRFMLSCVLKETYYCNDIAVIVTMANPAQNDELTRQSKSSSSSSSSLSPFNVVAIGGRYDNVINAYHRFSRQATNSSRSLKCGLGISFNIGKLAAMIEDDNEDIGLQSLIQRMVVPKTRLLTSFDVLLVTDRTGCLEVVRLAAKLRTRTIRVLCLPEVDNLFDQISMVFQFATEQKVDTVLLAHCPKSLEQTSLSSLSSHRTRSSFNFPRFHILARKRSRIPSILSNNSGSGSYIFDRRDELNNNLDDCLFCAEERLQMNKSTTVVFEQFNPYELVTFNEVAGCLDDSDSYEIDQIVNFIVERNLDLFKSGGDISSPFSTSSHRNGFSNNPSGSSSSTINDLNSDDSAVCCFDSSAITNDTSQRNWQSSRSSSYSASLSCSPPPRRSTLSSISSGGPVINTFHGSGGGGQCQQASGISSTSYSSIKTDISFVRPKSSSSVSNRRTLANSIDAFIVRNMPFLNSATTLKVFAVDLPIEIVNSIAISINDFCAELATASVLGSSGFTSPSIGPSSTSSSSSPSSGLSFSSSPSSGANQQLVDDLFGRMLEQITSYSPYKPYTDTIAETLCQIGKYLRPSLVPLSSGPFFFVILSYNGSRFKYQLIYKNFE